MEEDMKIWNEVRQPPKDALKVIGAGRLKGKTDINPQWRYEAMTKAFGVCGCGWKFEIESTWIDEGSNDQRVQNVKVLLYVRNIDEWSAPIPGVGGSMLVVKEKAGLYTNDEAVKMAVTDALSTAMKMLGVASDIYRGAWDGSKYRSPVEQKKYKDFEFLKKMGEYKEELGEKEYYKILGSHGYSASNEIPPGNIKGALGVFAKKVEILKNEGGR